MDIPDAQTASAEVVAAATLHAEAIEVARVAQMAEAGVVPSEFLAAVKQEIKSTVNGKIDRLDEKIDEHNKRHEDDMKRILPIIEAYEFSERRVIDAKAAGKFMVALAGVFVALGSAWMIAKQLWPWL